MFILILFLVLPLASIARDAHTDEALNQAKQDLTNKGRRQKVLDSTPDAKSADDAVSGLAGSEQNKEQLYQISADVMTYLYEKSNGDPIKMQELLMQAQKDPEGFLSRLPSSERQKIKSLADQIEKQSQKKNASP